ncbi:TetR/AcrR family transcriptional regulator [Pseudomaricurvus alkylphenolicus]|jgi:AcrR family transcriptional regulator|uniref:TetR/AcrR family transcriptional regulator n=1 Tax=Pseudomaricurvus alkylphenolicus TaxID=1306991 RepID=UPI00141E0238|nr:TetR/AcrR family transcriptional regulator [Pseudomaricurvus alkylphenolicus]NIB41004.1 TetR/AcrR family transcriptional regulator [Pseudomaricurvus alkylphenolicus]
MDLRRAKSRQKLKDALGRLLEHQVLEEITIEQITDEAGVTRPTFYSNYKDRQSIVVEHIGEWLLEMKAVSDQYHEDESLCPLDRLTEFLKHWLGSINRDDPILRLALTGRAGDAAMQTIRKHNVEMLRARSRAADAKLTAREINLYAVFYGAAVNGVLEAVITGDIKSSIPRLAEDLAVLIHTGLGDKLS